MSPVKRHVGEATLDKILQPRRQFTGTPVDRGGLNFTVKLAHPAHVLGRQAIATLVPENRRVRMFAEKLQQPSPLLRECRVAVGISNVLRAHSRVHLSADSS